MSDRRRYKKPLSLEQELIGEWNLLESDNFEVFLEKIGFNKMHRQIATLQSGTLTISFHEGEWTMFTEGAYTIHRTIFRIGETKEERTIDGRTVVNTWSAKENEKLLWIEVNQSTGVEIKCELFVKNQLLVHKMKCAGVRATRTYTKSRVCTLRRLSSVC
ncbi:hypothetical protein PFISCL1PPCAC_22770 [Pristionchus fissidentatus]|uniref:Lipocalin/cytosolic fatty-acid binding domain-containing protein n=1 Tax=Pristionchus fissidentatus TaxID=1538716 RepID=A0AAV5WJ65_9BILA|nr:hypothetical protein PFISCL1PPCAC_22770 [Pristionchus fissidentatus]